MATTLRRKSSSRFFSGKGEGACFCSIYKYKCESQKHLAECSIPINILYIYIYSMGVGFLMTTDNKGGGGVKKGLKRNDVIFVM